MNSENTTVKGTVTQANERGFQLHGRADWLNWSKYAEEPRTLPAPGHTVSAVIDKAGFVRSVQITGGVTGKALAPHPVERTALPQRVYDARFRLDCLALVLEHAGYFGVDNAEWDSVAGVAAQIEAWAKGMEG